MAKNPATLVPNLSQPPIDLKFEGPKVRFVGSAEKPECIAADVCDLVGIKNVSQALADLDDDEKGICTVYTANGKQTLLTLYESGLYQILFKSRKPEAKRFRKWVTNEVLPSIRKYGVYPPPANSQYQITLKPYTARVVWVMQVRRALKQGYWCVFIEAADLLIGVESILGPANFEMRQYDLIDGSIGLCWGGYRQDKRWAGKRIPYAYTFPPDDPRGTVTPWSYPMQELEHFKHWLHTEYWTVNFPKYLKNKFGAKQFQQAIPIFASLGVPVLPPKK